MKYKIKAQNIRCDGCVSKIKETLGSIEGVHFVDVSIEDATVTIETNGKISKKIISDRLKEIGYPEQDSLFSGFKKMFSN
jgi:copper chaperone CopZ